MISPNLFYSQNAETYFWVGSDLCNKCNTPCSINALLLWDYYKTTFLERLFCYNCREEILRAGGKYKEFKQVSIMFKEFLPSDSIPVWPERPSLSSSNGASVFDVAVMKFEGVKTVDHTFLSNKSSTYEIENKKEKRLIE